MEQLGDPAPCGCGVSPQAVLDASRFQSFLKHHLARQLLHFQCIMEGRPSSKWAARISS
jgi:hypothetical protein